MFEQPEETKRLINDCKSCIYKLKTHVKQLDDYAQPYYDAIIDLTLLLKKIKREELSYLKNKADCECDNVLGCYIDAAIDALDNALNELSSPSTKNKNLRWINVTMKYLNNMLPKEDRLAILS